MEQLTGALILLLSCIGHAELWVVAVNRSHAFRIRAKSLRMFRALHDLAIVVFPWVLLVNCGLNDHGLLRGGTLFDQTEFWRNVIAVTLLGTIPFFVGVIRWQWLRRFEFHKVATREIYNVAEIARLKKLNDVRGSRWHPVVIWPWNEILTLEVNVKRIQTRNDQALSRRPLRLIHFSDLHFIDCPGSDFYRFMVEKATELNGDAMIFTGDLIDKPELLATAVEILKPLTKIAPCFFILGNHDWRYNYEHFRTTLSASGWKCVTGSHERIMLAERQVLFAGSELPWIGNPPPAVKHAGVDVRILLSHSPDQLRFAQAHGYDLMLSGHTHGGQVVLPIIGPVYAPSIYGVDLAAGLFERRGIAVHVSRGVGAKDPLRWNCRPELTCLEVYC
ncbi:MAG: metallophosphoesterase [Planctomycetaceae bacterium]|nr:metallophosphoesterase [Planctomycetaceae bacterium]